MKIILSIKNSFGKNVAFVTDNLKLFLLAEILEITKQNQIEGVYLVNKNSGSYLRSKKNIPKNLQLDAISIGSDDVSSFVDLRVKRLNRETRAYLYNYLIQPKHNIFFEGAILSDLINNWKKFIDLKSHFDILATLYSLSRTPHSNPKPNDRGIQIAGEFYNLAKTWL